jgi:transcriptional antiterminator RfaH
MQWYVIRTKPRQERIAEFHLRQLSIETFLPQLKHQRIDRCEGHVRLEPLFPRYLFARFQVGHHYRAVNFSRGVVKIVEFGLKPAEVSQTLIDGMKAEMVDGYVIPGLKQYQEGQVIHITGGPLAGLEAVFVKELKDQHRVMLLLRALGLSATLTMNRDCLSLQQAL